MQKKPSIDSTLSRYATSAKAKELLKEFLREKTISEKATALGGICDLVGYSAGSKEIDKILDGTHKLSNNLPLQTLERFWTKHVRAFGNQTLRIHKTGKSLTMVDIDIILSEIHRKIYFIHAKIITGEFNEQK